MILDGKDVKDRLTKKLRKEINKNNYKLRLDIIQIGKNEASLKYIRNKEKMANDIGAKCVVHWLRNDVKESTILRLIRNLNKDCECNGIIVQLPLPKNLNFYKIMDTIDPRKDIDGFTSTNISNLYYEKGGFASCTNVGIMKLFEYYKINLRGANVTVIGRSPYLGKSLFHLLMNNDATVTLCHSKTENLKEILKRSDIIISAVGKEKFIKRNMLNPGVIIIDVGINFDSEGNMCGDVDFDNVQDMCTYITPVPGGVGTMTVAGTFLNLLDAYKIQKSKTKMY